MWPGHVVDRFNVTVNQGRFSRARCFVGSVFLHYQTIWDRCADGPREFDQSAHVWRQNIPVWRFTLRRLSQGQFAVVPVTCSLFEHPALWPHVCMKINCRSEESRASTNTFTFKCLFCCLALKVWCVLVFLSSEAAEEAQPSSHVTSSVKTMTKTPAGAPRQGNGVPPPAAKSWHSGSAAGEMLTRSALCLFLKEIQPQQTFCHRLHAF